MDFGAELEKLEDTLDDFIDLPDFSSFFGEAGEGTEVQEIAPNAELQAEEIRNVFDDIKELQYDEWKELSIDERVEVMNAFEQKIAQIEMRDPIPIEVERMADENTLGYYSNNDKRIALSDRMLADDSPEGYEQSLRTLFHEGRHAYQWYNLEVNQVEQNDESVQAWNVNFNILGYDSGSGTSQTGYWRYYTQPVEVDARQFAETVINELKSGSSI